MTDEQQPMNPGNGVTAPTTDPVTDEAKKKQDEAALAAADQQAKDIEQATGGDQETETEQFTLPDKFKTVQSLIDSYAELEKKLGSVNQKPPETKTEPPAEQNIVEKYTAKYFENGELSTDDYAELKKAGYDQQIVDGYIEGQKAKAAAYDAEILKSVPGGKDEYDKMVQWGKDNYSDDEMAAYNTLVSSGNITQAKMAVGHLMQKYSSQNKSTTTVTGTGGSTTGTFSSWQQVTEAMSNPKYKNDPAYRQQVQSKLNASGNLV